MRDWQRRAAVWIRCRRLASAMEADMRLYSAICSAIEAWAERTRTETFEAEMENADWAMTGGSDDDD